MTRTMERIDRDRLAKRIAQLGPAIAAGLPPQVRQLAQLLRRSGMLGPSDPLSGYQRISARVSALPSDELYALAAFLFAELAAIDGRELDKLELAAATSDEHDPALRRGMENVRAILLEFLG